MAYKSQLKRLRRHLHCGHRHRNLHASEPQATLTRSFGDTSGAGVLRIVESIAVDRANGRLLIAEELETDPHLKVYDLDGRYTGRDVGRGLFPQQAEGIALYACGDTGYWIVTDQGENVNTFHVLDRLSFRHLGSFRGGKDPAGPTESG